MSYREIVLNDPESGNDHHTNNRLTAVNTNLNQIYAAINDELEESHHMKEFWKRLLKFMIVNPFDVCTLFTIVAMATRSGHDDNDYLTVVVVYNILWAIVFLLLTRYNCITFNLQRHYSEFTNKTLGIINNIFTWIYLTVSFTILVSTLILSTSIDYHSPYEMFVIVGSMTFVLHVVTAVLVASRK